VIVEPSILVLTALTCAAVGAVADDPTPTAAELARARQWAAEHLRQAPAPAAAEAPAAPKPGLVVVANNDRVLVNGRPDGRRIKLADVEFDHGLICHAPSRLIARLPSPGRTFSATIGVDANAGGGTVIFSVSVGAREALRTGVLRGGEAGVPVTVDLAGATEFTIAAGDAGDGIACDHADWAGATVALADGTELRLSDLPLLEPEPAPRGGSVPPFSFTYGGRHSDDLLPTWEYTESIGELDDQRTRTTHTYTDPTTGLELRCVAVGYADFPVVEWTVYLKNTGAADTPIVEDLQALDTRFRTTQGGDFLLHHNVGSPCQPNDYEPLETSLGPGVNKRISAAGGRPTNSDLCYFNLAGQQEGVILALGWPGQWAAQFLREDDGALRVVAGQELTHFALHPGEEVRTPLVVLQFWSGGDWIRAQNTWRRWMIAHNIPRPDGKLVPMHYGTCFSNLQPLAEEEIPVIKGFIREGVKLDYYFIDAGWYPDRGNWPITGTWEVDTTRFPNGLREVADLLHANGMKFVVWFEPERCAGGTWITENHPEWVLGGADGGLVNLGNPDAWQWVVDRVDSLLTSEGIDVYRQDFNIDPLSYWRANDTDDRQGITEIKHIMGYLAYWDELLRRHPGLWIDTCASGGRRNDLETLRRSVPLLRSDYFGTTTAQQAQTMGIAQWMPYFGSGMGINNIYWYRSCIFPAARVGCDTRDPSLDYDLLKRMIAECYEVQRSMMGDFYPLTPYSLAEDAWVAWQFHQPDNDEGVIQAFRRAQSQTDAVQLKLRGLDPYQRYLVRDADTPGEKEALGRELMEPGLTVTLAQPESAAVVYYRRR